MEYTKIDLEDGSGAELIDLNRASSTTNPSLKSIKHDTRDLLRLLETSTSPTVGIIDVSHSGWAYRKKLNGEWKKYFCHLDGSQLFFFDHPGVSTGCTAILLILLIFTNFWVYFETKLNADRKIVLTTIVASRKETHYFGRNIRQVD